MNLTSILKHIGKHIVVSNETISGWKVKKYADGTCEGYKDVEVSGTITALASSGTFAAFGYLGITPEASPSGITLEAFTGELLKTDGWGFLARMAGTGIRSDFRFISFGGGGKTRNLTIRWKFTGTWK